MEQDSQKRDSQKDTTEHMNEIKWILICGFLVVLFFTLTEPVEPALKERFNQICTNNQLSDRNKINCFIFDVTGRVLDPHRF